MPRFDGTGPNGLGPINGIGIGRYHRDGKCKKIFNECLTIEERIEYFEACKKKLEVEIAVLRKELK